MISDLIAALLWWAMLAFAVFILGWCFDLWILLGWMQ